MKIQKHIERAIEDINFAIEWETKDKQDKEIKFWLEHMYMQGQIDLYKQNVK
jgi:hypothetical protein